MSGYCEQEKVVRAYSCCDVHSTWDRWCEYTCAVGIMFDINYLFLPFLTSFSFSLSFSVPGRPVRFSGGALRLPAETRTRNFDKLWQQFGCGRARRVFRGN